MSAATRIIVVFKRISFCRVSNASQKAAECQRIFLSQALLPAAFKMKLRGGACEGTIRLL
jgi:hypothetical protein